MGPGCIYFAALGLIVAPSMWINRMAVLIAALWLIGQPVYLLGVDVDIIDASLDAIGLLVATYIAATASNKRPAHLMVALTFAPMFAVHVGGMWGALSPFQTWWAIFWLALLQIALLPFGNDWRALWDSLVKVDARIMDGLARHFEV